MTTPEHTALVTGGKEEDQVGIFFSFLPFFPLDLLTLSSLDKAPPSLDNDSRTLTHYFSLSRLLVTFFLFLIKQSNLLKTQRHLHLLRVARIHGCFAG